MLVSASSKKRAVGIVLFLIILGLFLAFNRIPKLDAVGVDLAIVESPNVQCFQGFCIDRDPGTSFLSQWWTFSVTYFRLVAIGMAFAFVVAGLAESFLFTAARGAACSMKKPATRLRRRARASASRAQVARPL